LKVLILGISRSGTTSLLKGFKHQKYITVGEPFNKAINLNRDYPLVELIDNNNICVKSLCNQIPNNLDISFDDFIKKFIKEFDKIILLDRKNSIEHEESFVHMYWRLSINQPAHTKWSSGVVPNDFKENFYKDGELNRLYLQKEQLKKISNYINTPITWYEELYGEDRIQSLEVITKWDLDLDSNTLNEYLNPKHKLKQTNKTII